MKHDIPTEAGVGFTLIIAAATFAIAVGAGIFLIYEPDLPNAQSGIATQSQISLAQTPDAERLSSAHSGSGQQP